MKHDSKTGSSQPSGATLSGGGVNFSQFSRLAVELIVAMTLYFFRREPGEMGVQSIATKSQAYAAHV